MNNLISIFTGIAMIGASALTLEGVNKATDGDFYLASVKYLAQESAQSAVTTVESHPTTTETTPPPPPTSMESIQTSGVGTPTSPRVEAGNPSSSSNETKNFMGDQNEGDQPDPREFIDPRQIQEGLRNINQFRGEARRTIREIKKQASASDLDQLNSVLAEVDKLYATASNASNPADANDAVREFYDNQYWEKVNDIRARLQIPKEIKQITQSIRRLEKIITTKSVKNIGLDLDKVAATLTEMKQTADTVQNLYSAGNYQEAQEEMRSFHEGGQPGEIEGVIFRIRDIKNMAKRIKDKAVLTEIDGVLQEVVDAFNAGEYRDARETMDEYADDLQRLISQLVQAQSRRGFSRRDSSTKIQNLGDLIGRKLQEADSKQEQQTSPSK